MNTKKLWGVIDSLRSSIPSSDYITIISSIALVQFHNPNTIQTLLQSGNNTPSDFYAATQEAADALHLHLPTLLDRLNRSLKLMTNPVLQNFQFYTLEIFKNLTPSEFLESYFHSTENSIGKIGGEHLTPSSINELALKIIEVQKEETFLDPTCGFGNAIVSVLTTNPNQKIFGQEIYSLAGEIAQIRVILAGATKTTIKIGDVLRDPKYVEDGSLQKFDVVYSDAPIGMKSISEEIYETDPYNRFMFGSVPKSRADWAFVSNGINSLKENGRGIFIVPLGALFRGGKEQTIRERVIQLDLFEAVIKLSSGLLPTTSIPIAMLIINKNKRDNRKNKIMMINAEDYVSDSKQKNLTNKDISAILDLFNNDSEIPGKSKLINKDEIIEGSLTVERYVKEKQMITDQELGDVIVDIDKLNSLETVEIQKIATVNRGVNLPSKHDKGEISYRIIKISDVVAGEIDFTKLDQSNIPENTKIDNYLVQNGDLLISTRGENIKTAVIKEDIKNILVSQNFVLIRVNDSINVDWLKFYLDSPIGQVQLKQKMKGETVLSLSPTAIKELKIPFIDKYLQDEIMQSYNYKKEQVRIQIVSLQEELAKDKLQAIFKMGLEGTLELLNHK